MGPREGSEGGGGRGGEGKGGRGRGDAGSGAEKRGECESTRPPIDAGIVPGQPRETQDHLEVTQTGDLKGEDLGMGAMDTESSGEVVSDGASGGGAAINEFQGDWLGVGKGGQMVLNQDGRVQE